MQKFRSRSIRTFSGYHAKTKIQYGGWPAILEVAIATQLLVLCLVDGSSQYSEFREFSLLPSRRTLCFVENENSRWRPGSHCALPLLPMCSGICAPMPFNICNSFEANRRAHSQDIMRKRKFNMAARRPY